MANQELFATTSGKHVPPADTTNAAGGKAYALSPKQALAQYAVTGCFGDTYYANASAQLTEVLALAQQCDSEFIAKCAVYARQRGHMKDMPALLLAMLAARSKDTQNAPPGPEWSTQRNLALAFPLVVDNGKMLRNFAQIVRSGVTGRKSFGTAVRRMMRRWIESRSVDQLFRDSVGDKPSLADVIKMVHPKAADPEHDALYAYLAGSKKLADKQLALPTLVRLYEDYKSFTAEHKRAAGADVIPDVPFEMLDSLGLDTAGWTAVAKRAGWQMLRMNLNTFARHGVLQDAQTVEFIAGRLRDPESIRKARVFPYQLLMAYKATEGNTDIPMAIKLALQDAMEIATDNVPAFGTRVVVAVDTSGSMSSPITGHRTASSAMNCVDVAALIASCIMRKNPETTVMPFDTRLHTHSLNPRDTVMTNAATLARFGGGGTDCSLALQKVTQDRMKPALIIYVSDNESWMDSVSSGWRGTGMATEWSKHKAFNPTAKLVCIDLTPHASSQVRTQRDVLNVGGFSDAVFDVMMNFIAGKDADSFVREVDAINLGG